MAMQQVQEVVPSFSNLPTIITLLIALSVATERLTEIIKGMSARLNERKDDPKQEARRKALLQLIAVVGGIVVSALTYPIWKEVLPSGTEVSGWSRVTVLAMGLLASGGSGFWNSMLTYVTSIKDLKRETVENVRAANRGAPRRMPEPAEGNLVQ